MKITHDWMDSLSLAIQGVLMLPLRGPDGAPKECVAKDLTRAMRAVLLRGAHFKGHDDFMGDHSGVCDLSVIEDFSESHDQYPHHWIMHIVHAAEIIGYLHPNTKIRIFWATFYLRMVHAFHLHPETKEEMLQRLRERDSPYAGIDLTPCPTCSHAMHNHDLEVGACSICTTFRLGRGMPPGSCLPADYPGLRDSDIKEYVESVDPSSRQKSSS